MKKKLPFVSVVVSAYNEESQAENCINSLLKLNYPKNKYEIIYINDYSTDNTKSIIQKFAKKNKIIKLINNKKNQGRYKNRNIGLRRSKGEIIAYLDGDCSVNKSWLKELTKYYNKNVLGVGGVVKPYHFDSIIDRYMAQMNYGNPVPIDFGKTKNIFKRFFIYVKYMIKPLNAQNKNKSKVLEIFANASFRKKYLEDVGLWNEEYTYRGDSEMCNRLYKKFPSKKILFNKKSIIYHQHKAPKLTSMLKDTYRRSKFTFDYYIKIKKFPPIFPFPLIILSSFIVGLFFNFKFALGLLFILPHLFYVWHFINFIKKKSFDYLIFPYIQFLLELFTIFGLIKGAILYEIKK